MLNQVAVVTLRILLFRAGPQDLPYSSALTQIIAPLYVLAEFAQYRLTLATGPAIVHALVSVAATVGFIFLVLQTRGLLSRLQQTANAIFVTGSALTVVLLPPLSAITPHMLKIAQNPDLARSEPLPALPALLVMALTLWGFMVVAHIFRHALNANLAVGAAVALLAALVTVSFASGFGMLLGL
jgi:hypothetical protein